MTQNATQSPSRDTAAHGFHRSFAVIACLVAVAVFLISIAIIFAGWGGHDPATALIVVQGDPSVTDAVVTLFRPNDRGDDEKFLEAKITDADDYRLRFHVPPGPYRVNVLLGDKRLLKQEVIANDRGEVPYITILMHPPTRPSI